jgi:hypothetical protein
MSAVGEEPGAVLGDAVTHPHCDGVGGKASAFVPMSVFWNFRSAPS